MDLKVRDRVRFRLGVAVARALRHLVGTNGYAILCSTSQGVFAVDPEDLVVGRKLLRDGRYGEDELSHLAQYLTPESRALVVGAHVGALAVPISKKVASVLAVEANPRTFRLLKTNVALNECANITLAQIAASDKREVIAFLESRVNSGGSKRLPLVRDKRYFYDNPEQIEVAGFALDDYTNENFDLIVMDIEGSEIFALRGMSRILLNARAMQMEFLPHHLKNVGGARVRDLTDVVAEHFDRLWIPSTGVTVSRDGFEATLQAMYDNDQGDDGIVFSKVNRGQEESSAMETTSR